MLENPRKNGSNKPESAANMGRVADHIAKNMNSNVYNLDECEIDFQIDELKKLADEATPT